jgi:hypothetical protein
VCEHYGVLAFKSERKGELFIIDVHFFHFCSQIPKIWGRKRKRRGEAKGRMGVPWWVRAPSSNFYRMKLLVMISH